MRPFLFALSLVLVFGCSDSNENKTASPGTLAPGESAMDTGGLITDSVIIRDSNTTDIEAMKKIN